MDEVLAESIDFIYEIIWYQINDHTLKKENIKDYKNVFFQVGLPLPEAIKIYRESMEKDIWNFQIKPVSWSIEKIKELVQIGHELFIVTARNSEYLTDYTIEWVKKYYQSAFRKIIFADHHTDKHREKSEICIDNGIEIMIEDNLDFALELAKNGIKTFLLEKPWNIHRFETHDNIIKVKNWKDIVI